MDDIKQYVFLFDVAVNYIMLFAVMWSIAFPDKRVWPPPGMRSWQHVATWGLYSVALISNVLLIILDWNTWLIPFEIRYYIGIPVIILGTLLVSWGILTLGMKNTSGLKGGFVLRGPYRYTRNPQYTGDMLLFLGISLVSNSVYVLAVHLLLMLVFLLAPFTEEVWLEKQYGEEYINYKRNTSRFF